MSVFMKNWAPQEHQMRKKVTDAMNLISNWINTDYKESLESFLEHAFCDRKIRKQLSGAKKCVKIQLKAEQNNNFSDLKHHYNNLKEYIEEMADDATDDRDLVNFVNLEHVLLDYLNHWTPRLHTKKPEVGKNIQSLNHKGPNKSSIKRFKKERQKKSEVQRQFIDNAPEEDGLFRQGVVSNEPFAHYV